jgi:hypothetical protein
MTATPEAEPTGDLPHGIPDRARWALAGEGIAHLNQLPARSEADLLALHGEGPKAGGVLRGELARRGLGFKPSDVQGAGASPRSVNP